MPDNDRGTARPSPDLSLPRGQRDEPHPLHGTFSISCIEPCVAHRGVSQCSLPWTSWKVAGRSICGRPLYRSPDGNTVTIELFNRGAATWAAGRSGSSGARTAYTVAVSLNDGFPIDLLVDAGAMGLCIIRCCVIVAQVGIAGSTILEDFVQVGGQAAMAGRLRIGQGAQIGAQAGVISDVSAGAVLLGSPAQPRMEFFRQVAALKRMVQKPE